MISYFSAYAMAAVIGIPITKAVQRSSIIVDGHIEKISPCVGVKNKKNAKSTVMKSSSNHQPDQ